MEISVAVQTLDDGLDRIGHKAAADHCSMSLIQSSNNVASGSMAGAQGQQGQQQVQQYQAPSIYPSLPSSSLIQQGQALPTMTGVIQQQQQYQQQRFGPSQPSQPQQLVVENNDPVYGPLQRSSQSLETMLRIENEESMANELTRLVGPGARELLLGQAQADL